ncbi:MAG: hypothetical protein KDD38_04235 [Bdellovibrionales bacterium]|nr:hypothetical protein [Bdellovibrionales bacterium]
MVQSSLSHSSIQTLININTNLTRDESQDSCLRTINFMTYELATLCDNKTDREVLEVLNDFFFKTKNFKLDTSPLLLASILAERRGCGIALAYIYMHLAKNLGLELHLIHWPLHAILKWECEGKAFFIDLEQNGKLLSEEELLLMVNKHKDQLRTLSSTESTIQYLSYILTHYRQENQLEQLHRTLSEILNIEPENTRYLAERALLRREMGLIKESICDFKRYFSFTDRSAAPAHVITAYDSIVLIGHV